MTETEYNTLMFRAEAASKIKNEISDLKCALIWFESSNFNFRLGQIAFSEVGPGYCLPQETWDKLREEITGAIKSRIKELQQQFKEL